MKITTDAVPATNRMGTKGIKVNAVEWQFRKDATDPEPVLLVMIDDAAEYEVIPAKAAIQMSASELAMLQAKRYAAGVTDAIDHATGATVPGTGARLAIRREPTDKTPVLLLARDADDDLEPCPPDLMLTLPAATIAGLAYANLGHGISVIQAARATRRTVERDDKGQIVALVETPALMGEGGITTH